MRRSLSSAWRANERQTSTSWAMRELSASTRLPIWAVSRSIRAGRSYCGTVEQHRPLACRRLRRRCWRRGEKFEGLAQVSRELIGKAEAIDWHCRAVLDVDSTQRRKGVERWAEQEPGAPPARRVHSPPRCALTKSGQKRSISVEVGQTVASKLAARPGTRRLRVLGEFLTHPARRLSLDSVRLLSFYSAS